MKLYSRLLALVMLLITFQIIQAQSNDCPQLVRQALVTVQDACANLGRNEACYGHNRLESTLTVAMLQFNQPADRVPIDSIQKIHTFPLNEQLGEWGVALLHIQANLPDTLPGQAVKFILYGDVEVTNAGGGDTAFKPMQAFYFTSGGPNLACTELPPSSLVIQSPGGQKVNLTINGLDLNIGSSVALRARPGERMTITTLEGLVETTYAGETRPIPGGFNSSAPLGGEQGLIVNGPPEQAHLFDDEAWRAVAETTDGIFESKLEIPDTDLWDSAESYCADSGNEDECRDDKLINSLSFKVCDDGGCDEDNSGRGGDDGGSGGGGDDGGSGRGGDDGGSGGGDDGGSGGGDDGGSGGGDDGGGGGGDDGGSGHGGGGDD